MRVLHIDSGREYRGGQDQVRLLTRELAGVTGGGLDQRLLTRRASTLARRVAAHGTSVREVPWGPSLDPRALWRLYLEATTFHPDILHAHDSHGLQLAYWARRLSGGGPGDPALVATRRVDFHVGARSVWHRVDRVIAISEAVRAVLLADGLAARDIAVVPSGVDAEEIRRNAATPCDVRARLGLAPGTPLVANVAALVGHKDQDTLLRAAHAARATRPDLHWVIAGEGELRASLEATLVRLGLGDRVHLLGHVAEADALIAEADMLVMSSKEEGLGSVVLHALALGKPVCATRGGGLPEIVPADWLSPSGDAEALARSVVRALEHAPATSLPPRYTAAAMAAGVVALYRSLV